MILSSKEVIKIMLNRKNFKQKDLANVLSEKTGKKYTPGSLSQKINRGTITYNEVALIADILGYSIGIENL